MADARRVVLVLGAAVVTAALVAGAIVFGGASGPPRDSFPRQASPPPLATSPTGPGYVGMIDPGWAKRTAAATGIPLLAVLAYAGAAIRSAEVTPDCGLGWNTIAAIGFVESNHGRHGGSVIGPDYRVEPPIFGVILDGGNTANIPDTDGGAIDGNSRYDRAVGPMQIIPQTWTSWPSDGNGDGIGDPQNIADAAVAAANYLCHASGGMSGAKGWRAGIAAYNAGADYLAKVASTAQRYMDAAG